MKKIIALLTCLVVITGCIFPCSAAENSEVIYYAEETLDNGITVVDVITVSQISARAMLRDADRSKTYRDGDTVIAEIAVTGTFRYDGTTVSVVSKSISKCETYDGWSFKQSSFTSSGGTITLTGTLNKLIFLNADVNISLTCDKNGNIS